MESRGRVATAHAEIGEALVLRSLVLHEMPAGRQDHRPKGGRPVVTSKKRTSRKRGKAEDARRLRLALAGAPREASKPFAPRRGLEGYVPRGKDDLLGKAVFQEDRRREMNRVVTAQPMAFRQRGRFVNQIFTGFDSQGAPSVPIQSSDEGSMRRGRQGAVTTLSCECGARLNVGDDGGGNQPCVGHSLATEE